MPNYANAKIYKIVSPSNPELVYYGSTCEKLSVRKAHHMYQFRNGVKISSSAILQHPDHQFILVEEYPCESIEQLKKKEYEYINSNVCVNRQKIMMGSEEEKIRDKEYNKRYIRKK